MKKVAKTILGWLQVAAILFVIPFLIGIVSKILTYIFMLGWKLL